MQWLPQQREPRTNENLLCTVTMHNKALCLTHRKRSYFLVCNHNSRKFLSKFRFKLCTKHCAHCIYFWATLAFCTKLKTSVEQKALGRHWGGWADTSPAHGVVGSLKQALRVWGATTATKCWTDAQTHRSPRPAAPCHDTSCSRDWPEKSIFHRKVGGGCWT